jgi:putative photosynthetic complex assembly protein
VAVLAPGTNGFIRGVLRGLARDRRSRGISQEPAFRLAQWPDGRLSLEDLATGKRIELGSFGATNRAAFAQILASDEGAPS